MRTLPAGYTKKIGTIHMVINLAVVGLFICSAWMRHEAHGPAGTPFLLSVVAILMLLVSGWLGGKMVFEAGVGVSADESAAASSRPGNRRMEA